MSTTEAYEGDLEELFREWFGAWDILKTTKTGPDEIEVSLKDGKKYLFGRKDDMVYLHSHEKQGA